MAVAVVLAVVVMAAVVVISLTALYPSGRI